MTDEEKRQASPEVSETPAPPEPPSAEPVSAPAPEKPPLNDQKKNALLRYMAVLFGVAFLLVALSFLIQMRDSSQQISQLSQTNASALQNAEKLQNENRALTEKNQELTTELDETSDALKQAAKDLEASEQSREELESAARSSQDSIQAYSLLVEILERHSRPESKLTLADLKPLEAVKENLDTAGRVLYDNLVAELTAAS